MPLITETTENEVQSWFKTFAAAFTAMAFGGAAGLSALRAVNVGRSVTRVSTDEIGIGGALTPLEQSYVAGKLAGSIGVTPVRKMNAAQLRRGLDATGVSTITQKDQVILSEMKRRQARSMLNKLRVWEQNVAASVSNANTAWDGLLASGEAPATASARRVMSRRALAGLAEEVEALTVDAGAGLRQVTQTGMAQAFQQGQGQNGSPNDIVYKIPRMSAEKHCMRLHLNADGTFRRYIYGLVAGNSNIGRNPNSWVFTIGPVHPHCVPAGQRVLAEGVRGVSERPYEGDVVVLRTAGGHELSVTPNHPILSDRGWVEAGLLKEGDRLVRGPRAELGSIDDHHDDEDVPACVEEVAKAFRLLPSSVSYQMPVAAEDFHGDGFAGEAQIHVVPSDGLLRNTTEAALREQIEQVPFVAAPEESLLLALQSVPVEALFGARSPGRPGSFGPGSFDVVPFTVGADLLSLVESAWGYAGLQESVSDESSTDSEMACQDVFRRAGEVELDELVAVDREYYSGQVYNLQVMSGWYQVGGIITKNCYCILRFERKALQPTAEEKIPGPNKALADRREKTLGGKRFRSSARRSQAGRRHEARVTGRRGRRFGDEVEPELGSAFQPRARGRGSLVDPRAPRGTVAVSNIGRSAPSTWETGRGWWGEQLEESTPGGCCQNRPPGMPPEEYEALLQAARDFYGTDSPTR